MPLKEKSLVLERFRNLLKVLRRIFSFLFLMKTKAFFRTSLSINHDFFLKSLQLKGTLYSKPLDRSFFFPPSLWEEKRVNLKHHVLSFGQKGLFGSISLTNEPFSILPFAIQRDIIYIREDSNILSRYICRY